MMNFTYLKKQGLFLFTLLISLSWSNLLNAQFSHTLTVTAPTSIAGSTPAQIAAFGPLTCDVANVNGELILAVDTQGGNLACTPVTNDLSGKIAVVDRGVCNFSIKVYEAQQRGANAVIVCNNSAAAIITMAAGPNAELITVPSFMVSQAACQVIKTQIANGVTVTIARNDVVDTSTDIVVWGNEPGQGDFNGGLNGWTVASSRCGNGVDTIPTWTWSGTGTVRGSCGGNTILSPTRCNGAAIFETDFLDSGTGGCGAGGGICPAGQFGELVSPIIDVSGSSAAGFSLTFWQMARQFQSSFFVAWSKDQGITWDTTQINTDLVINAAATNGNKVRVPLIGTGGAQTLQVKFIYSANYYYWAIDDVKIIEQEANNMRTNSFFAVPPNAQTPLSQVEPIAFLADIENIGAVNQTNVTLNISIFDEDDNVVYTDDLDYGTVPANTLVENIAFDNLYTPSETGEFLGVYSISADAEDFDANDNDQEFVFLITDNLFAKEYGTQLQAVNPAASNWPGANEPTSISFGNCYFIPNGGQFVQSVSFAIANANAAGMAGRDLLISIYEWNDANGNAAADPDERTLLGFNVYTITGTETPTTLITVPLPFEGDPSIELEAGKYYLAMVEYLVEDRLILAPTVSRAINYSAMRFLTTGLGEPRFFGMWGLAGDMSVEPFGPVGFGFDYSPVVRMTIGADPTSTENVNVLANNFSVFPNPTTGQLNVQLNLENAANQATLRVFDISGRMIQQRIYDNVQKENFQYDFSNLSAGTYFIQLITAEGIGTKKFVVSK